MVLLKMFLSLLFLGLCVVSGCLMLFFSVTTAMKEDEYANVILGGGAFLFVQLILIKAAFKYPKKLGVVLEIIVDFNLSDVFILAATFIRYGDTDLFFVSLMLCIVCACSLFLGSAKIREVMRPLSDKIYLVAFFLCYTNQMGKGWFVFFVGFVARISFLAGTNNFCPLSW